MNIKLSGEFLWAIVNPENVIQHCIVSNGVETHLMPMIAGSEEALKPMVAAALVLAKNFQQTYRIVTYREMRVVPLLS